MTSRKPLLDLLGLAAVVALVAAALAALGILTADALAQTGSAEPSIEDPAPVPGSGGRTAEADAGTVSTWEEATSQILVDYLLDYESLDAIARAFSFQNGTPPAIEYADVVSREFSFWNDTPSELAFTDVVSREFTFQNGTPPELAFVDVVSREFSFQNKTIISLEFADVVSREFTFHNETIVAWKSVRTHGNGVGPVAITLSSGYPVVEPRLGGIQEVVVEFAGSMEPADGELDPGDVAVTDGEGAAYTPTSVALTEGGTKLEVAFDPGVLPDMKRYTIDLAGKFKRADTGVIVTQGVACQVDGLVGDANGSGLVDNSDMIAVRVKRGQDVTEATCRCDVTCNGVIDNSDMIQIRVRRGHEVPSLAPGPSGQGSLGDDSGAAAP